MHVAVVEDDEGVADALVDALEAHWMTATHLGRGQDVLIRHLEFDIVLLDLGLPDLDGLEVCRRIRSSGRDVPVLMLTARTGSRRSSLRNSSQDSMKSSLERSVL